MNRGRLALVTLAVALAGCKGACSKPSADAVDDDVPTTADPAHIGDAAAVAPPRCSVVSKKGSLGPIVDVGDAIVTPSGFAVGLLRKDNVLSVALVSADLATVTFADVGPTISEAPPLLPFLWDGKVYVAWIQSGVLSIGRVDGTKVAVIAETVIALPAKDSLLSEAPDLDVAVAGDRGVVVWDEETPKGSQIHVLSFDKSGFAKNDSGLPLPISPPGADDEDPRLAPRAGGYWAVWVGRNVEDDSTDASEGPGESPSTRWLEAAPIDARGVRVGEPLRMTPTDGHIAGFDLLAHDGVTDIVARDGAESMTEEGTSLLHVTLADKPSASSILAAGGIGRAVPVVVATAGGGLVVVPDLADATKILPILPSGALPSLEPTLKGARALVAKTTENGADLLAVRLSGATLTADDAEIVLASCAR
ncbi:MAG: hypothetical protein ABI551_26490 [Polyangiaceae bacterium]